jgi:hypothetical protein
MNRKAQVPNAALILRSRSKPTEKEVDTHERSSRRDIELADNSLLSRKDAHIDVLLPMVSAERPVLDAELALGYEEALSQTRRYWHTITACSTRIEVPEAAINDCIRQSVRFSNLLTERNPAIGKYCKVNRSWTYADLWATPGSMDLVMLLDTLGYHRTVERYLNIFLEEQGIVKPPGPAY